MLNPATGHVEKQTILSVAVPRETLDKLIFETIDCSEAMSNFVHRINFSKTKEFSPVGPLIPIDFLKTEA